MTATGRHTKEPGLLKEFEGIAKKFEIIVKSNVNNERGKRNNKVGPQMMTAKRHSKEPSSFTGIGTKDHREASKSGTLFDSTVAFKAYERHGINETYNLI